MAENWCGTRKKCMKESFKTLSAIHWKSNIVTALKMSIEPKRFVPFFFIQSAIILLTLLLTGDTISGNIAFLDAGIMTADVLLPVIGMMIAFAVLMIVNVWITGAMIHQAKSPKEYRESFRLAFGKLHHLIIAMFIVSLISNLSSMVQYIGALFVLLFTLMFLFVNQSIMISGNSFLEALKNSSRTFWGKKLVVLSSFVVGMTVTFAIVGISSIPLLGVSFMEYPFLMDGSTVAELETLTDTPLMYAASVIILLGIAISTVFSIKFITDVYLQLKKKKWAF